jgi:hypothetical protein
MASQLVNVDEGAKRLAVSPWTLRSYAYKGVIASVKLGPASSKGTRLLFEVDELDRFIAENRRPRFAAKPVPRNGKPARLAG